MTTAVILQPSYLPWRGVFDLVRRADVFVFYDDVQYDKHGWRNRNRFKTAQGTQWLTVPVNARGNVDEGLLLRDTRIVWATNWAKKHLATIRQSYARAPHLARYAPLLEAIFARRDELLCNLTIDTTMLLAKELGLTTTRFVRSSELGCKGERTERLIEIVRAVGADHYLSGPSAKDYIDPTLFERAKVGLEYIVYDYPAYEQLHGAYDPQVSVLDLLFMKGADAPAFIWKSAS